MVEINRDTINGVRRCPAPWNLRGKGYILLYRFPEDFVMQRGRIPAFLSTSYAGGLGAVMIIENAESKSGPYSELLFIPGMFRFRGKKLYCITKIYVSTREGVVNGWKNWAIPKEQADFNFPKMGDKGKGKVVVRKGSEHVMDITLNHGGNFFPIHTALSTLLPFPLVQEKHGKLYYTSFIGHGRAQFTNIEDIRVNPELFPDIYPYQPLMGIRVDPFAITFPTARVIEMARAPIHVMNRVPSFSYAGVQTSGIRP